MKNRFQLGDRVIFVIDQTIGPIPEGYSGIGTIVEIDNVRRQYGIKLDCAHPLAHDLMGRTKTHFGYYVAEADILKSTIAQKTETNILKRNPLSRIFLKKSCTLL